MLTASRLNDFRVLLESTRKELLNGGRNREAISIDSSPDELDRLQNARDRDQSISSLERESRMLREIGGALQRLDLGQFGVCTSCDQEISPARLKAVPWAEYCVFCQTAEEQSRAEPAAPATMSLAN